MKLVSAAEYAALPRHQPRWLVPKLIPAGGRILLLGPPKSGKSHLALDLALAVAQGTPWLGQPSTPGPVWYLDIDQPDSEILERISSRHIAPETPLLYALPDELRRIKPLDICQPAQLREFRATTDLYQPSLVVVDVLREIHRGDENDSGAMRAVCTALSQAFFPASLLILHHSHKVGRDERLDPVAFSRGSSYLPGWVDAIWLLYQGHLYVDPRFDAKTTYSVRFNDDTERLEFPELPDLIAKAEALAKLCEEFPHLSHGQLVPIAKERFGIPRATYFRLLAGRVCIHTLGKD